MSDDTPKRRRVGIIVAAGLLAVALVLILRSQPTSEVAGGVNLQAAFESGQENGIKTSVYPDGFDDEPTLDDGEIPEDERLVVPMTDETGKLVPHPECATKLRDRLGAESGQLSIGALSDRFHLEHQKDAEVLLGYSDPKTQQSMVVPFTVEDMKYALDSGVVAIRPEKGIRTMSLDEGKKQLYLFSNNMAVLADMRTCRVIGLFLPKNDGDYHDRVQSWNGKVEIVQDGCKKKKCNPTQWRKCVRGRAICGRRNSCPRGWSQRGHFLTGCGHRSADQQFSQLCRPPQRLPSGVRYLGCRLDSPSRILYSKKVHDARLTLERCRSHCRDFKYFGMEYGKECWCGDKLNGNKYSSKCTHNCPGNRHQKCGGSWAINVYERPAFIPSPIKGFSSVGCLSQTTRTPVLRDFAGESATMTYRQCWQRCANKKRTYRYFGIHAGKKCFCGDRVERHRRHGMSTCSTNCAGSKMQKCGGRRSGLMSVFKRTVTDPQLFLARMYGPLMSFNRRQTNYPMDAQIYYDRYFVGKQRVRVKKILGGFCKYRNVIQQTHFDPRKMRTYYAISNCKGRTSIKFNWFYGFQYPCEPISCQGSHDQDWEGITVVLNQNEDGIERVIYNQHGGHYTRYPHGFPHQGLHTKIYVGYSSHGSYHRGTVPGQHKWHKCQYFGDCVKGRNPRVWSTWKSTMYSLPAQRQRWMLASSKGIASGIFTNRYGQTKVDWQDCGGKSCGDTGCQQNQCGIRKDCAPCTFWNQGFVCHGWGLGPSDWWCCGGKCKKKRWWRCP